MKTLRFVLIVTLFAVIASAQKKNPILEFDLSDKLVVSKQTSGNWQKVYVVFISDQLMMVHMPFNTISPPKDFDKGDKIARSQTVFIDLSNKNVSKTDNLPNFDDGIWTAPWNRYIISGPKKTGVGLYKNTDDSFLLHYPSMEDLIKEFTPKQRRFLYIDNVSQTGDRAVMLDTRDSDAQYLLDIDTFNIKIDRGQTKITSMAGKSWITRTFDSNSKPFKSKYEWHTADGGIVPAESPSGCDTHVPVLLAQSRALIFPCKAKPIVIDDHGKTISEIDKNLEFGSVLTSLSGKVFVFQEQNHSQLAGVLKMDIYDERQYEKIKVYAFDVETGKSLYESEWKPEKFDPTDGKLIAISPSGQRIAILSHMKVEIYDLY